MFYVISLCIFVFQLGLVEFPNLALLREQPVRAAPAPIVNEDSGDNLARNQQANRPINDHAVGNPAGVTLLGTVCQFLYTFLASLVADPPNAEPVEIN